MLQVLRDLTRKLPVRNQGIFLVGIVVVTLVSSAIAVTFSVHKSRQYLYELQELQAERDHLETEWGQLLLEQHAWGAYGRIGRLATEQLQMRNPAPTEIIMVRQ
ncbi:MAG TPA: cell division protein FtsL [Moraxellaceae bacterium]|nr:cell division protein FtsL [Moraxellaceae bacterium]